MQKTNEQNNGNNSRCPKCGHDNRFPSGICNACGNLIIKNVSETTNPVKESNIAWEQDLYSQKPLTALLLTIREIYFNADGFFRSLQPSQKKWAPLFFALITGTIGLLLSFFWATALPSPLQNSELISEVIGSDTKFSPTSLILTPLLILIQVLLTALYAHGALIIFRARRQTFKMTLTVACYAEAAMVLQILPFIGPFASTVFWIFLILAGLHAVHNASRLRIFFALLTPVILLMSLLILVTIIAIVAGLYTGDFSLF